MKLRLRDQKENIVYLLLWLVLFLAPVINMLVGSYIGNRTGVDWHQVLHLWRTYLVYFIIFLIHNFLLAPILVYQNRRGRYLVTTLCLVAVGMFYHCMNKPDMKGPRPLDRDSAPPVELAEPRPADMQQRGELPPPDQLASPDRQAPHDGQRPAGRRGPKPELLFGPGDMVNSIFLILLLGMNIGVKLYFKSDRDKKELQELQRKNLENQLEYLKYQVNPHFFMNTLNNIHALVDIDPEKAKTSIVDLSKLMRYVLYEGANATVPLSRDLDFLRNYMKLMQLRYTDRVSIKADLPTTTPDLQIPPMLLITFVENAFKHGVSYKLPSFIDLSISTTDEGTLLFSCRNSKHTDQGSRLRKEGGVGLTNVQRRLDLIFGDRYTLDVSDEADTYSVSLRLPLKQI